MKRLSPKVMVPILILILVPALASLAEAPNFGARGAQGKTGLSVEQMLTYAIQDEYLARAEYELIIDEYGGIRPFSSIVAAEQRHIEWVAELFNEYGYALPKDTAGLFVVVPDNLRSAFETGVQAELDNIAMYTSFLGEELPRDVRELFERLKQASENHLRAFRNNLNRYN
jgi:hypothetical protein